MKSEKSAATIWRWLAIAVVVAAVLGSMLALAAWVQVRGLAPEQETATISDPNPAALTPSGLVRLNASHAQVLLVAGEATEPSVRLDAEFDPRYYRLTQNRIEGQDGPVIEIDLAPLGSRTLALMRMKVGGQPAKLRVALPPGVRWSIEASADTSFVAAELGAMHLEDVRVDVSGGAATLSFQEATASPMQSFQLRGDTGSVEVTGLGNASPREVVIAQRLGEIDLDLRGHWSRDATVTIDVALAGGSLWLPENVEVRREALVSSPSKGELGDSTPTLQLNVTESAGRLIVFP